MWDSIHSDEFEYRKAHHVVHWKRRFTFSDLYSGADEMLGGSWAYPSIGGAIFDKFAPYESGAVHRGAGTDYHPYILYLLERGENTNQRSGQLAITPFISIFSRIGWDTSDTAQMVIEWGADLNARDSNCQTIIFTYALVGSLEGLDSAKPMRLIPNHAITVALDQ